MAGAGNDFIIINAEKGLNLKRTAINMCDRTSGIGADGLLVLDKSKKYDHRMRIINSDGSEAEMCGNGARCMAAYIRRYTSTRKAVFSMETLAGEIMAKASNEAATIRLSDPKDLMEDIVINVAGRNMTLNYINTGVPHVVMFVDDLETVDVLNLGNKIRFHSRFLPAGTNVNFVKLLEGKDIGNRTYERGVENETKACGTGSVASALISYIKINPYAKDVKNAVMKVHTRSGEVLTVTFDLINKSAVNVWLRGGVKFIAEGKFFL
jgi:diaminopimelate epimerase